MQVAAVTRLGYNNAPFDPNRCIDQGQTDRQNTLPRARASHDPASSLIQEPHPVAAKKPAKKSTKPAKKVAKSASRKPTAKPVKKPAAKPAAKKAIKKGITRKPAGKAKPVKKPVAKKPVAKKVVAKKIAAKKVVAKKVIAKKVVAKKVIAKKPAAKPGKAKSAAKPVAKPIAKPVVKPVIKPVAHPVAKVVPAKQASAPKSSARSSSKNTAASKLVAKPLPPPAPPAVRPDGARAKAVVRKDRPEKLIPLKAVPDNIVLPKGYKPTAKENYMNPLQMEYFRRRLLAWRADLVEESKQTIENLKEEVRDVGDEAERATRETENSLELRTRDRYRKLIGKIDDAVKRIDDGIYGYCVDTGDEIGLDRLEARLTAERTIDAQERWEHRQKQMGD